MFSIFDAHFCNESLESNLFIVLEVCTKHLENTSIGSGSANTQYSMARIGGTKYLIRTSLVSNIVHTKIYVYVCVSFTCVSDTNTPLIDLKIIVNYHFKSNDQEEVTSLECSEKPCLKVEVQFSFNINIA